jgi:hypothetical protein
MQMLDRSIGTGPDHSWCRRLGNFASPGWAASTAPTLSKFADSSLLARRAAPSRENLAALRLQVLQAAFGVATAAALAVSYPAAAQMGSGMGGHGGHGGHSNPNSSSSSTRSPDLGPTRVPNPLRAMLAQMPKLRADLLLTAIQLPAWSAMEDALRDSVELARDRAPVAETQSTNGSSMDAGVFVQDMADKEHAYSDALARVVATMKTALASLNSRQSKLVHDRFAAAIEAEMPGAPRADSP